MEKFIKRLDEWENSLKQTLEYLFQVGIILIKMYDDIFGYPWGGILLCSIVWLMVGLCLVQAGVAMVFSAANQSSETMLK